jgi:DNA-binding response OmpR family regulator
VTAGEPEQPVVLVAEDEPDLMSLVKHALEEAGYEVLTASDGAEALRIALDRTPDVAVLDIRMPKLSGLDVIKSLRLNSATGQIPVMLLTAVTDKEEVARGFQAGALGYIEKPFSPSELVERVDALVDR